jgi:hypothetical protein
VAILVGSRDQRTQFWKRAIQIPFHQTLVAIGSVMSEEKIKVYDVRRTDGRTEGRTDGRTTSDGKSSLGLWPGELKITFSKKYSYNGCILVLPSTETHSIHNLIKAEF